MAKQTFTTGQVLTAAQMTSLQQTAMGGGSTTAKTASYVLVAADAGTVVQMNSASATTITVNTALFAAGDTVQIQNVGAGVCTVTAGTATVNTSSTLALKQYDAGSLYFNSTSAAIFFATDAADSTSPLTTKGDLYGFSTLDARIPIGTNNQVLTADSAQALGLKWATPTSGGMTLLSTTTLSGSSTSVTSISGSYVNLLILVENAGIQTTAGIITANFNAGTTNIYQTSFRTNSTTALNTASGNITLSHGETCDTAVVANSFAIQVFNYASGARKGLNFQGNYYATGWKGIWGGGGFETATAITSFQITTSAGTFSGGTLKIYGVN